MGVLAQAAARIAATETNIDHVHVANEQDDTALITFEIKVSDRTLSGEGCCARCARCRRRAAGGAHDRLIGSQAWAGALGSNTVYPCVAQTAPDPGTDDEPPDIHTDLRPKAIGTYSQAVRVGDTVYLSGQIPLDPTTGELVARRHRGAGAPRVRQPAAVARRRAATSRTW